MFQKSRLFYTFAEEFAIEWHTVKNIFCKRQCSREKETR